MYTKYTSYRGDFLTVQKGNVCTNSWMDRKVVTVMSTTSQPEGGSVLRRQKDGTRIPVPCPLSIIDYNNFMGGVDRGDQVQGYYSCRTKCRKFYKYIFHFLLDVVITNAYILQKGYCATVAVHHSITSKHFGCSWQASSLVSTAVDEELVVVLVFFVLSLSATILQPSQRKILTRRPNTEGPDIAGATTGARGVSTLLGTALSVSYGCATRESDTQIASCCVMLNTYQNKINLLLLPLLLRLFFVTFTLPCHPISTSV